MQTQPFKNPYLPASEKRDEGKFCRFNTDVDKEEYNFVRLIRPQQGTMAITITTLFHKLVQSLKAQDITNIADCKRFEHFVSNCTIQLQTQNESQPTANAKPEQRNVANGTRSTTRRSNQKTNK